MFDVGCGCPVLFVCVFVVVRGCSLWVLVLVVVCCCVLALGVVCLLLMFGG